MTKGILNTDFPKGQPVQLRLLRRIIGYKAYALLKAIKLSFPITRETYSQSHEDLELKDFFPNEIGKYLDIGAGYPVYMSNTFFFYKLGWSGILVEPLTENVILGRILRNRDRIIQGIVSAKRELTTFYELDPSFYSTIDSDAVQKWLNFGAVIRKKGKITSIPVSDMDFICTPTEPCLVSIDVEGAELEVLNSFDWNRQKPRVFIIETWEGNSASNNQVDALLTAQGYLKVKRIASNDVWCHITTVKLIDSPPQET